MNIATVTRKFFLKLCYFSFVLTILSCGSDTEKKKENTATSDSKTTVETKANSTKKTIVFFGDSLTAGYGLDNTDDAFPGVIQEKIDSLNLSYSVVNSGVSGETTTGGRGRINWVLKRGVGTNTS